MRNGKELSDDEEAMGSCSPKGILSLNPHLVKAPRECIEYVLVSGPEVFDPHGSNRAGGI